MTSVWGGRGAVCTPGVKNGYFGQIGKGVPHGGGGKKSIFWKGFFCRGFYYLIFVVAGPVGRGGRRWAIYIEFFHRIKKLLNGDFLSFRVDFMRLKYLAE